MDGARNADIGAMFRVGAYLSPRPQTCAARLLIVHSLVSKELRLA
jgi:hypothetical protein